MAAGAMRARWDRFWHTPAPLGRIAVFRAVVYLYLPLHVIRTTWVTDHSLLPSSWYAPLQVGRILQIPHPTQTVAVLVVAGIVGLSPFAVAGRGRRLVGPALALLYLYWCYMGFSYGKVDHDRLGLLVSLAVLPSVPWSTFRDNARSAAAGWALRAVQVSVVLVYFLSAVAKLRLTGPSWITSSILAWAIVRRGTDLAQPLLDFPTLLKGVQAGLVAFELASPLLLLRGIIGRLYLIAAVIFHAVTFAALTISFEAHMVCLLAFLPLERFPERFRGWSVSRPQPRFSFWHA